MSLAADLLLVRTSQRERLVDVISFALDYLSPKEPVASDPAVPAELSRVRGALVAGPSRGWLTVLLSPLLREDELVERVARLVSKRTNGACLRLVVTEGTLLYELYRQGDLLHSYCSSDAFPEFRQNPEPRGQAEELLETAAVTDPGGALALKLARALEGPVDGWGEELLRELVNALGLPEPLLARFEELWEDGLLDELIGETTSSSFSWGAEEIVYLEAESHAETDSTAKRWLH